ncbi:hypothetical protein ACOKM5_27165 [Streptomyces sp. BH097]|uniref:hypothetical protein n=1 Tax=unclassified Streptomyces TaxID=2593676 RepID=UPI003BB7BE26
MKAEELWVGALVVDEDTQRVGRVMGREGPYVQLRPPGGGREWDADPTRLRRANDGEKVRAGILGLPLAYVEGVT